MLNFDDHFSQQAGTYARYRPSYPPALFDYLAGQAPARRLAWDVGTGNGQAALALAERFERVYASDASAEQLARAPAHARIEYRVERAEDVSLAPSSVDLVTVAVAAHWFNLDGFYAAVRRVAAPGGLIAVWAYHLPLVEPLFDRVLHRYYAEILADYWPAEVAYIEQRYATLPFPFAPVAAPPFEIEAEWDLSQLVGFLESWSGTQRYRQQHGTHPVRLVWAALAEAWGKPEERHRLRWPLHVRAGRVHS